MEPIYLDHHATTPCDPRVAEAMWPWFAERFGNAASRSHAFGREARDAVEDARAQVAAAIGASPKEIVWTSGATESDNLAILGLIRERQGTHVVTVVTEHKAVLDPCKTLMETGVEITALSVDSDGLVSVDQVRDALRDDTALVSVMTANNEIGVLQPIAEIGALCQERDIPFHTDAAQALGRLPVDVGALNVDLMSLSAHKMYGPKGVGALYVRRGRPRIRLQPLQYGGGHERGMRSGTLPVPLCVGMGLAAQLAVEGIENGELDQVFSLRDRLLNGLTTIDGASVNGSLSRRLPNNLNLSFQGVEAEALMMGIRPIAVSTGSACSSATLEPSYVLRALGVDDELAHSSIRFGVGRFNTKAEIDTVIARVTEKVAMLRQMNPLYEV